MGRRPLALAPAQLLAHAGVGGDDAHGASDLGAADLDGGIDAVDDDAVERDLEREITGERGDLVVVVRIEVAAQCGERNARYIAPVSRYASSKRSARRRDTVDLPDPAGPSMAITLIGPARYRSWSRASK